MGVLDERESFLRIVRDGYYFERSILVVLEVKLNELEELSGNFLRIWDVVLVKVIFEL